MGAEQEAKFQVHDCRIIEYCLRTIGQVHTPWHFERNTLYDRGQELQTHGHILRLRITDHATLTFKEPMPGPGVPGVKAMREIECQVHEAQDMHLILRCLGFERYARYEKFRSVWNLDAARVYLDIVPLGHFVEIEADPELIGRTATALGLDPVHASSASYLGLYREQRHAQGLEPDLNMIFDHNDKEHWAHLLGCALKQ